MAKLKMVMFSHLSDVQEMIYHPNSEEDVRMRINFVKMLLNKLDDGIIEMEEDELNAVWRECNERYGLKKKK